MKGITTGFLEERYADLRKQEQDTLNELNGIVGAGDFCARLLGHLESENIQKRATRTTMRFPKRLRLRGRTLHTAEGDVCISADSTADGYSLAVAELMQAVFGSDVEVAILDEPPPAEENGEQS
jgi:hypothetical protein